MSELFFSLVPAIGVEITNRCNLTCRHCFNHSGEGALQELSLPVLIGIFEQIRDMGQTRVRISGGEPTLHTDFAQVVLEAERHGLEVSINSHGLYAPSTRAQLIDLPIALFIISLDGLRTANDMIRGKGVFDRVKEAILWLRASNRNVVLGVHLRRSNIDDVPGLFALAAELDVALKFSPVRPIGRARTNLDGEILTSSDLYHAVQTITHLRPMYPELSISTDFDILQPASCTILTGALPPARACCPAGRTMLNINYDGYVYPCAFLVTGRREFAAGHIGEANLPDIWHNSPVFQPFRTLIKDVQCQRCFAYGQTCTGGCLAMSYFMTGRLESHDPTCFIQHVKPEEIEIARGIR